ncbi:hypothetical protein LTR28_007156, partial [Elasticomyces elasticus]
KWKAGRGPYRQTDYYSYTPVSGNDIESYARSCTAILDTKKIGVCYSRPDNTGHCVVYQLVWDSDPRERVPSSAAKRKEQGAPSRRYSGQWQFVDYQTDPRGRGVAADVSASNAVLIFAIEPKQGDSSASFGRLPL